MYVYWEIYVVFGINNKDETDFNWKSFSQSSLFTYAIQRGSQTGFTSISYSITRNNNKLFVQLEASIKTDKI